MRSKQSRQASRRARGQFRDSNGHFMKKDTTILIDEFGDHGKTKESSRFFGIGVTITEHPEHLIKIINDVKKQKSMPQDTELKASDSNYSTRKSVIKGIKSEVRTESVFIDKKKDVPEGWNRRSRPKVYLGTMAKALDEVLPHVKNEHLLIIIDQTSAYKPGEGKKICEKVARSHGKYALCSEKDSSEIVELQAGDFVTSAAYGRVRRHRDAVLATKLKLKPRRLRGNDSISDYVNEKIKR